MVGLARKKTVPMLKRPAQAQARLNPSGVSQIGNRGAAVAERKNRTSVYSHPLACATRQWVPFLASERPEEGAR